MNYCYQVPDGIIQAVPRIIVLGDIHGDWKALISALKLAQVVDGKNHWRGDSTHLVQVGDILDRGGRPATHEDERSEHRIIRFLLKLQKEALTTGGAVHILLGNHELMNVMGNFRYVSPMGMTDFDGKRHEAFKPGGTIAKQLACNTNSVLKIGSWLFSHAGILPNITKKYNIKKINNTVRDFLLGNTKLDRDSELVDMFWHRQYGTDANCNALKSALADFDSKYMVVGHSVQYEGINSTCSNALWRVDVGMSDAFGDSYASHHRPHARVQVLEILNDGRSINIL